MEPIVTRQLNCEPIIETNTGGDIPVFIFPTAEMRHILLGINRGFWAVSDITPKQKSARATKARQMPVGANGLFYCSDQKCFTTPFIIKSTPEDRTESEIWPGNWNFPFRIQPRGGIAKRINLEDAKREWKTLQGVDNITKVLRISGGMAFVPSRLHESDWNHILNRLSDPKIAQD